MNGTFCLAVDEGKPASDNDLLFCSVADALADAPGAVPELIAEELSERLSYWRALPADMSDADRDAAFLAKFPEAQ